MISDCVSQFYSVENIVWENTTPGCFSSSIHASNNGTNIFWYFLFIGKTNEEHSKQIRATCINTNLWSMPQGASRNIFITFGYAFGSDEKTHIIPSTSCDARILSSAALSQMAGEHLFSNFRSLLESSPHNDDDDQEIRTRHKIPCTEILNKLVLKYNICAKNTEDVGVVF